MIRMIGVGLTLAIILAAAEEEGWWDTPPGQALGNVLRWLIAVGVVAAAWKGIRYIVSETYSFHIWGLTRYRERKRREVLLDEMLSEDGWPQLKRDMAVIMEQLRQVHNTVDDVHEATVNTTPPLTNKE